ncbi:AraC family transcriptional regulator [Arenibacter sp. F26102]|uniref:helix-turn-helix domain-containing protein n=1 Tax=Arenibacter sp. F26102 TaxID=2926416 RepID=UPI001FF102E5|nr:AraC family transcriptional regulator [Arenibacter sp. F26102]MCK0145362.1 AraC family transcriptional regulator [Arenibacter sp. F26102]
MKLTFTDKKTQGKLLLFKGENQLDQFSFGHDHSNKFFTIVWNPGPMQLVTIDNVTYEFETGCILPLLFNQTFSFERPTDVVAWQFNREFYCIVDNDKEVSCTGFLFGTNNNLFIKLKKDAQEKLNLLLQIFIEELQTSDHIQNEMLVVLLKRLIIFTTTLAKIDYVPSKKLPDEKFHIIRNFIFLVELNFRSEHSVKFYAGELCKSPKTLSNLFAIYNHKTPSKVIQERIVFEAKRLLSFTEKSVSQISDELGFNDVSHFSGFFKKSTQISPLDFRNNLVIL